MNKNEILSKVDHTLLKVTATENDIKKICDEAINAKTASVCIPQCYVKMASEYVNGKIPICTVIGFPNGNSSTTIKAMEAAEAFENGAKHYITKPFSEDDILSRVRSLTQFSDVATA